MSRARSSDRPRWPLRLALWGLLALPALALLREWFGGGVLAMDLLHPTGETALRLMVLAMLAGPLVAIFGRNALLRAWLAVRRDLGLAAFGYTLLHLYFYALDMGAVGPILEEVALPGIWTGWLAFVAMFAAAAISSDAAMRALGRWWKRIQRGLYAAALLVAAHWWLLERDPLPGLLHLAPLILAWSARAWLRRRRAFTRKELAA